MNRIFSARSLLAAAVAVGAFAAVSTAHARTDVSVSIGVHAPYGYVQPAPVYVQPRPVYVQPQPVYVQPRPIYVQPQPIYYGGSHRRHRGGPWGDADRDGVPNRYDRDSRWYEGPRHGYGHGHGHGGWGDADRDGVPNRYDRAPGDPYRR